MSYLALKHLHVLLAVISISGFVARSVGRFGGHAWVNAKPVRIAPHVIDTALFASGIALWITVGWGSASWLLLKLGLLLVYIVAGVFVIRESTPQAHRIVAFSIALASVTGIVMLALSKTI